MVHAVGGGDVHVGGASGGAREHGVYRWCCGKAHHHRAGFGVDGLDLADAVDFLEGGGVLVLADAVRRVIGE